LKLCNELVEGHIIDAELCLKYFYLGQIAVIEKVKPTIQNTFYIDDSQSKLNVVHTSDDQIG
jgi:hypothetical protein